MIMGKTAVTNTTALALCSEEIQIPSYQRQGGQWKVNAGDMKIQLCCSVMNEFPVGSVVVHAEKNSEELFLMDGQQRRECFNELIKVRPFLDILCNKFTNDPADFQEKIEDYLKEKFYVTASEDFVPLTGGIMLLVELRNKYGKRTWNSGQQLYAFEKLFANINFLHHNPFLKGSGGNEVFMGEELITKLISCHNSSSDLVKMTLDDDDIKEKYISDLLDELGISAFVPVKGKKTDSEPEKIQKRREAQVKKMIIQAQLIQDTAKVLTRFRNKVQTTPLGRITYTADTEQGEGAEFELPTIFRLINSSGVELKRVEILASAPRWNGTEAKITLDDANKDLILKEINKLRKDEDGEISKWLICAAFAEAIDKLNHNTGDKNKTMELLIEKIGGLENHEDVEKNTKTMEEGFVLKSLFGKNSVTEKDWLDTYKIPHDEDFWVKLQDLVDLQKMLQTLGIDQYFKRMRFWGWPLLTKIKNDNRKSIDSRYMIAALLILFRREGNLKATNAWSKKKKFIIPARKLYDKFVYHSIGSKLYPPGGADANMKIDLQELRDSENVPSVSENEWRTLMENLLDGKLYLDELNDYAGEKLNSWPDFARLLLLHIYTVNGLMCPDETKKYHIDHIIPKDAWKDYANVDESHRNQSNHFANLMILDGDANEDKKAKKLSEIWSKTTTKDFIVKYGTITDDEDVFKNLSKIDNDTIEKLNNERKDFLLTKFLENRKKFLGGSNEDWST